jgi:hypothetical protein
MKIHTKKGGADILAELVLSAIVFFLLVFFLFGVQAPKMDLNACASVVAPDATLACDISLNNLIRAYASNNLTYGDWLMNAWVENDKTSLDKWKENVSNILNNAFGGGNWRLQIYLPNKTNIFDLGGKKELEFGCNYTLPFPPIILNTNCTYSESKSISKSSKSAALEFETPDGNTTLSVINDGSWLGAECKKGCNLNLAPKSIFEEARQNKIPNNGTENDSLYLPVIIANVNYELTLEEKSPDGSNLNVTLMREPTLQNCGLTFSLKVINITEVAENCKK